MPKNTIGCDVSESADFNRIIKYLRQPIKELGPMSGRLTNCLYVLGVRFVADVYAFTEADYLRSPNFGRKSFKELEALLLEEGMPLWSVQYTNPEEMKAGLSDIWRETEGRTFSELEDYLTPDHVVFISVTVDQKAQLLVNFLSGRDKAGLSMEFLLKALGKPANQDKVSATLKAIIRDELDLEDGP